MEAIIVRAVINNNGIHVKLDDVIKSLYDDYTNTDNSIIQQYIKSSINHWEEYKESIVNKAKKI